MAATLSPNVHDGSRSASSGSFTSGFCRMFRCHRFAATGTRGTRTRSMPGCFSKTPGATLTCRPTRATAGSRGSGLANCILRHQADWGHSCPPAGCGTTFRCCATAGPDSICCLAPLCRPKTSPWLAASSRSATRSSRRGARLRVSAPPCRRRWFTAISPSRMCGCATSPGLRRSSPLIGSSPAWARRPRIWRSPSIALSVPIWARIRRSWRA